MRSRLRSPSPDVDHGDEAPSKTQVKAEMHALQDLGAALLELPDEKWAAIDMPERLRDALHEYRRIPTMNAQARQLAFIGKLVRGADTLPLQAAVDAHRASQLHAVQSQRDAERWRERLLKDEAALTAWCAAHPGGDTRALRQLISQARKEAAQAEAAAARGEALRKGPAFRALFQHLIAALSAQGASNQRED